MARADLRKLLTIAVVLVVSGAASAQTPPTPAATPVMSYDTPAHVSVIDGAATLEREGRAEELTAGVSLLQGDRIRTSTGRAEILFPDGSALYADSYTQVEFLADTLVRAQSGRLTVLLAGTSDSQREIRYQIDTPGGVVRILTPGEFRVSLLDGASGHGREVVLEVVRGEAELSSERGAVAVRAGERSVARDGSAPSFPQAFNSARLDAFDVWTTERRDARLGTRSPQYLPPQVQSYAGTFDRYGTWEYDDPYGYVWYPRAPLGWRPYVNGTWQYTGLWGWTWVAYDPWGWPTHHFGRWSLSRLGAWFWIPSPRWAPAWVSWGYSPGYVAWCPLGFDNRPLFSFVNYNIVNYYEPFRAWTVIRHGDFGRARHIGSVVVDSRAFDHRGRGDRPVFVERPTPPVAEHAALRASAPIRAPSRGALGYAVPRQGFQQATPPTVNQGPRVEPPDGGLRAPSGGRAGSRSWSIMGPGGERHPRGDRERLTAPSGDASGSNTNGAVPRRWNGAERGQRIQGPAPRREERAEPIERRAPTREAAPRDEAIERRIERAPEQPRPEYGRPERREYSRPERPESARPERQAPEYARPARQAPERRPPSAERPAPPPHGEGHQPGSDRRGGGDRGGGTDRGGGARPRR